MNGEGEFVNKKHEPQAENKGFDKSPSSIEAENNIDDIANADTKLSSETGVKDGDSDIQVKFIINDSANGKGRCLAENALSSFSGLSKEELLKYANDPFWIRMRLLLFIFFWVVWIAMFVGAITIIVLAPKCEPKKPEWHEQGPLYEVDISKFVNIEGSESILQRMRSKLKYLSDLKVKGVILSPIFKSDENKEENVVDFTSLDDKFGTLDDFKELIKDSNEKDINLILSFVPNYSSNKHIWFNKSVARQVPYDNYYVWAPASGITANGSKAPPNNWLSVSGKSVFNFC